MPRVLIASRWGTFRPALLLAPAVFILAGCATKPVPRIIAQQEVDLHAVMSPPIAVSRGVVRYRLLSHLAGGQDSGCASPDISEVDRIRVESCSQGIAAGEVAQMSVQALPIIEGWLPWVRVSKATLILVPEGQRFTRLIEKRVSPRELEVEFAVRARPTLEETAAGAVDVLAHELTHLAWLARRDPKREMSPGEREYQEEFVASLVGACVRWEVTGSPRMSVYGDPESAGLPALLLPSARAARDAAAWLQPLVSGDRSAGLQRCRQEIERRTRAVFLDEPASASEP